MNINYLFDWLLKLRNRHFFILDTIFLAITPLLALALRLDGFSDLEKYTPGLIWATVIFLLVKLTALFRFNFYKRYWNYAGVDELLQIAIWAASVIILQTILFHGLYFINDFPLNNLPRSLTILDGMLSFFLVSGLRFGVRVSEITSKKRVQWHRSERTLIVGAGSAGIALVKQMQGDPQLGFEPVAFVDDDVTKCGLHIQQLPVVGNRYHIPQIVDSFNIARVIIAMPSVSGEVMREIVDICQGTGIHTSTLPGIEQLIQGRADLSNIRDVKIEDLLRRKPIQTDTKSVFQFIQGKKVLITGAGGSIGSELCRQVWKCCPAEIMLLGHGENSVFKIQQELQGLSQEQDVNSQQRIYTFIADLRFTSRLEYAFEQFKPDIIFHAAAHKHVPMMEENPPEAITNNVVGTQNLLNLALRYDVNHFVMISTDKAINPTSVMGASKRVTEMLVLQAAKNSGKNFAVVRFGNVLGSRGSVVPTFQKQIASGGPITVTHPEIRRYFMTIPEAVQLVLQASVLSDGGEVFMLDMGEPVKIVDLAKDLIHLSGYEVGKDVEIVFTGLRPGEKLFEELLITGEQYQPTPQEKLLVVKNASSILPRELNLVVYELKQAAFKNDPKLVLYWLEQLLPEYTPKKSGTSKLSEKKIA